MGRYDFSKPGCHMLGIRAGPAVGCPSPRKHSKAIVWSQVGVLHLFATVVLLHSKHIDYYLVANS